ncbi:MAG: group II intron reverse transcriptase domain-containing protein [Candidatus Aenigmarchaeota archaeon]|nr:group II intron reverse transcriptase domain-containing protein [Candidatus Aenigmarchaeota archaeon]
MGGGFGVEHRNLYDELCSFRNLELAYRKARKGKRGKKPVQKFESNLEQNILNLKYELETFKYKPKPLRQFIIRDPKTRRISASYFRDMVVHHALYNIIQPIFEKGFIYDSFANQINKGSSKAVERLNRFKRKVSVNGRIINKHRDNNMVAGYVLKADIKRFFDTIDHNILMKIIKRKVEDRNILILINQIIKNHISEIPGKGMPIGNLTSQFFANIYLNELDHFMKHKLKARYYIRYVDDFVVMGKSKSLLEGFKREIKIFMKALKLELHSDKTKVYPLCKGVNFLGFRIFYHYSLLSKKNIIGIRNRVEKFKVEYESGLMDSDDIERSLSGWLGYAMQADTYKLRNEIQEEFKNLKPL